MITPFLAIAPCGERVYRMRHAGTLLDPMTDQRVDVVEYGARRAIVTLAVIVAAIVISILKHFFYFLNANGDRGRQVVLFTAIKIKDRYF